MPPCCLASGDAEGALDQAARSWKTRDEVGISSEAGKEAYVLAVEAALALGDYRARRPDRRDRRGAWRAGGRPQSMAAHAMRHRALLRRRHG